MVTKSDDIGLKIKTKCLRRAFTMIELIYAIVFIGITILTVPMMMQVNNKALERNLVDEAIFLVSSVISAESTAAWDNNSVPDTGDSDVYAASKILDVNILGSGSQYERINNAIPMRVGGLNEDKHRKFFDYNLSKSAANQPDPAQIDDESLPLVISNSAASITGYKSAYTIAAKRVYVPDTGSVLSTTSQGSAKTNMKMLEVSISDADGILATLRTYTANIGEADFAKRRMLP